MDVKSNCNRRHTVDVVITVKSRLCLNFILCGALSRRPTPLRLSCGFCATTTATTTISFSLSLYTDGVVVFHLKTNKKKFKEKYIKYNIEQNKYSPLKITTSGATLNRIPFCFLKEAKKIRIR